MYYNYFIAHINNGVELLVNRVKGISDLAILLLSPKEKGKVCPYVRIAFCYSPKPQKRV